MFDGQTLANALYDLAARQEYMQPLREEIEEVISTHGWTKDGMGRMRKLDSFFKESSRLSGLGASKFLCRMVRVDAS